MTLTSLRRLVLAGNAAALLAAGASAWHALEMDAKVRPPEEWKRVFPVKEASAVDPRASQVGRLDEYAAAARWPQGDKPVEKKAEAAVVAPPPDPFETRYELISVFEVRGGGFTSAAQIKLRKPPDWPFSVYQGERVPADPGNPYSQALTEWVLDRVELAAADRPARAFFKSFETGEEKSLTVQTMAAGRDLPTGDGDGPSADDLPGGREANRIPGAPPEDTPPRFRLVKVDRETGNREFQVPPEEVEYLGFYSDSIVKAVSTENTKGSDGKPDGFVLKGIRAGSRPQAMGFQQEDKVVAVNGTRVTSKENAIEVGKDQYDGGTRTFTVTVLRQGREMNFTYRAPPK